jgi:multimeric flavodoxin WrbA
MQITILNGNPENRNTHLDEYLDQLVDRLASSGHSVNNLTLRDMDLAYCIGCLECWVKTPGMCKTDDDGREVSQAYINSDFVLWASPVIMGFYSALLKMVTDKFVGHVHPYGVFVDGEVHHAPRYESYPHGGLLLEKDPMTDEEDIQIISNIHSRTVLNFKSSLVFTKITHNPVEEVGDAINSL